MRLARARSVCAKGTLCPVPRHVDLWSAGRVEGLHEVELDGPRPAAIVSRAIVSSTAHGRCPAAGGPGLGSGLGSGSGFRVGSRLKLKLGARPGLCARLVHSPAQPQDVLVDVLGLAAVGAGPLDSEQALPEVSEQAFVRVSG